MTLRTEFQQAIQSAVEIADLSLVITRPVGKRGVTTQANLYAEALGANGLVKNSDYSISLNTAELLDGTEGRNVIADTISLAKDGILIVDVARGHCENQQYLIGNLLRAFHENNTVLILTGREDALNKFFVDDGKALKSRFPKWINIGEAEPALTSPTLPPRRKRPC